MPEITRLTEAGEFIPAYRLAQRALANAPNDQTLRAAIDSFLLPGDVTSSPPGASSIRARRLMSL